MLSVRAFLIASLLLASGGWVVMLGQGLAAQQAHEPGPVEVTTDTPEYCLYLQDRGHALIVAASAPPPHEATELGREGERVCGHGQPRGGILRPPRALLLIQRADPPAER